MLNNEQPVAELTVSKLLTLFEGVFANYRAELVKQVRRELLDGGTVLYDSTGTAVGVLVTRG